MSVLEFDSTAEDVAAMGEHFGAAALKRMLVLSAAIVATCAVFAACCMALIDAAPPATEVFAVLAGVGPIAAVLGGRARFRKALLRAAPASGAVGRRRLVLEDGGLRATNAFGETFVRWDALGAVVRAERHLFVMIGAGGQGIPLPRAAFPIPGDAEAFAAELERRRDATRAGVPPALSARPGA